MAVSTEFPEVPDAYSWMVSWRKKPIAYTYIIDFDNENRAIATSIALAELGRTDVQVTCVEYKPDNELKERITARIKARTRGAWADDLEVYR